MLLGAGIRRTSWMLWPLRKLAKSCWSRFSFEDSMQQQDSWAVACAQVNTIMFVARGVDYLHQNVLTPGINKSHISVSYFRGN